MVHEIIDIKDPRIGIFTSLTEAQLRMHSERKKGIFIAESPKVIRVAIERGYRPFAMLCERRHITGDASDIIGMCPDMEIYTGSRDVLTAITGYKLTRGVLCAIERKELPELDEICRGACLVGVLQSITDTTNIGAIFRSASALGVDSLILSSECCDPLNRRAVRVSMGTVFTVPWTISPDPVLKLGEIGFKTASLALSDNAISLEDTVLKESKKLAVVFGTEGDGLPQRIIESTDYVVKIPMSHGVDSLNVAAAAAVTFWELRNLKESRRQAENKIY